MMPTVTKKELVDRIAQNTHSKTVFVKTIIQDFLNEIVFELSQSNRIEFRDFGVFETRTRQPRKAQNPKTLESIQVPAKRIVKLKSGRLMKQKLNGKI
jgi:integration host factor subunit beta